MATVQKQIKCHVCNNGVAVDWKADSMYWQCGACKCVWMKKREIATYNKEYYLRGQTGKLMKLIDRFSFWDRYLTLGLIKTDRILEIGFGEGKFLQDLRSRGFEVWGVEKSEYARERMEKIIGMGRVFSDIGLIKEKFDVVVMYHVLEHIDDPLEYVNKIKKILSPSGRLVVRVPRVDSWEANLAGSKWYHLDYPNHQTLFSEAGLIKLFERSNLTSIVSRNMFGEYRQVLGYSILSRLGIKLNKWMMVGFQIITIPILWIFSVLMAQHGVIEVEGKVGSSNSNT